MKLPGSIVRRGLGGGHISLVKILNCSSGGYWDFLSKAKHFPRSLTTELKLSLSRVISNPLFRRLKFGSIKLSATRKGVAKGGN
jgi:hypothetical protein